MSTTTVPGTNDCEGATTKEVFDSVAFGAVLTMAGVTGAGAGTVL